MIFRPSEATEKENECQQYHLIVDGTTISRIHLGQRRAIGRFDIHETGQKGKWRQKRRQILLDNSTLNQDGRRGSGKKQGNINNYYRVESFGRNWRKKSATRRCKSP